MAGDSPEIQREIERARTLFNDMQTRILEMDIRLLAMNAEYDNHVAWFAAARSERVPGAAGSFDPAGIVETCLDRAIALMQQNQLEDALAALDTAIRLQPDLPTPYFTRGTILARVGKLDEAIAEMDRSISLSPTALAYAKRGYWWMQLHEYERALADFSAALAIDPQDLQAINGRSRASFSLWTSRGLKL